MTKEYKVKAAKPIICPYCKSGEYHPYLKNSLGNPHLLIRGYKRKDGQGRWWSHCLVCAGAYNEDLELTKVGVSNTKGWFITREGVFSDGNGSSH